ncbi:MAG: FHIPEP family type III secretion protein [bacterium]
MLVAGAVALLIFPVPAPVLDGLLAAQLGVAVVVLLAAVFARSPLALSQLPAVLLVTTLLRLTLNVSTTRLILADADAGRVVAAFGDAVVRGNLIVGAVVFVVLVLVQYLVIAKGAERVAQVAARFALDGLPGRQLAIDADVRAGLLDPEGARGQRAALARESSLFGALDGAMKFVRGDAIAGLCIVGINIVGGLAVGIGQQGRTPGEAVDLYTTLTIGDGLVTQLPAMLTAAAAALVVTRVAQGGEGAPGAALLRELAGDGRAPALAAGLLAVLACLPGLPAVPLALAAVLLGLGARAVWAAPGVDARRARVDPVAPVAPFGLRVHPDAAVAAGPPEALVEEARRRLRVTHGAVLGGVVVAVDPGLPPGGFRVEVGEAPVSEGRLPAAGAFATPPLEGAEITADPATGVPGSWRGAGPGLSPAEYLVAHLVAVWRRSGPALLGMQQVADALAALEQREPALVRAAVPRSVALPRLTALLRRLLAEDVPIRDLRAVLEALAHRPADCTDEDAQLRLVRRALGAAITRQHGAGGQLKAIFPEGSLEARLRGGGVGPGAMADLFAELDAILRVEPAAVIVAPPDLRSPLQALVATRYPGLPVVAAEELLPGIRTVVVGLLAV